MFQEIALAAYPQDLADPLAQLDPMALELPLVLLALSIKLALAGQEFLVYLAGL